MYLKKSSSLFHLSFFQMHTLLGENSIEENSNSCPEGEDGLECRRAEARKSVDCPHGKKKEEQTTKKKKFITKLNCLVFNGLKN